MKLENYYSIKIPWQAVQQKSAHPIIQRSQLQILMLPQLSVARRLETKTDPIIRIGGKAYSLSPLSVTMVRAYPGCL